MCPRRGNEWFSCEGDDAFFGKGVNTKVVPCNRLATHIIVYMGSKPVARYEFSVLIGRHEEADIISLNAKVDAKRRS